MDSSLHLTHYCDFQNGYLNTVIYKWKDMKDRIILLCS